MQQILKDGVFCSFVFGTTSRLQHHKAFSDIIIQPLCRILVVDQVKKEKTGDWVALKVLFCMKM